MSQQTQAPQPTSATAGRSDGGGPAARRPPGIRVVLFALLIAILLAMLNNMIVATAMLTIVSDLGGMGQLSWVVTAYTLATAASTPIWGKLGDLYPRKGIFLTSIVIFVVGSLLCGVAQSMTQLVGFRVVQGLGAGGLLVGVMAIIGELVPPRERGRYQGMFASVMSIAMIGGPLLGGIITDGLDWRWAFYINLPLGIIAFTMVAIVLHLPERPQVKARIDYLGAVLLTISICALVLLTTWGGGEYAWWSPTIIALGVVGVGTLALFLWVERRAPEPLLPLRLFLDRNFSLGTTMAFLLGVVMFGAMLFLPIYQQAVQGSSATTSGLMLMPLLLSMMVVSLFVGRATTRTGRYRKYPIIGSALCVAGLLLLSTLDAGTHAAWAGVYMALLGSGMGFLMQLTMLIPQNSVELRDMGVASSTVTLSRTLGGSLGVAALGALFNARMLAGFADADADGQGAAQLDQQALAALSPGAREEYASAVSSGVHIVFLVSAVVTVGALIASWFIKEIPLRGRAPGEEAAVVTDATADARGPAVAEPAGPSDPPPPRSERASAEG